MFSDLRTIKTILYFLVIKHIFMFFCSREQKTVFKKNSYQINHFFNCISIILPLSHCSSWKQNITCSFGVLLIL